MNSYDEITQELRQEELFYEPEPRKKEKVNNDNFFQQQMRPYYDMVKRVYPKYNVGIVFAKGMELFTKRQTMLKETVVWAVEKRLHPMAFVKTVNSILAR